MDKLREIYELTDELLVSIKRSDFDDVIKLVEKRAKLVKEYINLQKTDESEEEKELLSKIKIKKQEAETLLKQAQLNTGKELKTVSSNAKAVSAYKIMKNIQPVFLTKKICKNYSTGINNFCPIEILCGFFRLFFC